MTDSTTVEAALGGTATCPYRKGFVASLFLTEHFFLCIKNHCRRRPPSPLPWARQDDVDDEHRPTTQVGAGSGNVEVVELDPRRRWGRVSTTLPTGPAESTRLPKRLGLIYIRRQLEAGGGDAISCHRRCRRSLGDKRASTRKPSRPIKNRPVQGPNLPPTSAKTACKGNCKCCGRRCCRRRGPSTRVKNVSSTVTQSTPTVIRRLRLITRDRARRYDRLRCVKSRSVG